MTASVKLNPKISTHLTTTSKLQYQTLEKITKLPTLFRKSQNVKSAKEITQEIQAIMRQITASVTFLPLLNEPCCFDLLIYADKDATVPMLWEDSDPCFIANSEQVRLRSFNTTVNYRYHNTTFLLNLFFL